MRLHRQPHKYVMLAVDQGVYIASYDPDFVPPPDCPRYPSGRATFTHDPTQALLFDSVEAAFKTYRLVSVTCPVRPDGEPNRPLAGITIMVVAVKI